LLDAYASAARDCWGLNGVVLVAKGDREILAKGYGLADSVFNDPNTPETKFFIGSITKQFTAAAILLLKERGQLRLSDPIRQHLPDFPDDPGDRITIRQLMTHTSGIPDYTTFPEIVLRRASYVPLTEILRAIESKPLEFEPGTRFSYSNSGYVLLGEVIEDVSGQSYEAFLHKNFFKPLGMTNTGYGRREMGVPMRAEGYSKDESGRRIDAVPIRYSILHSAGALYSTAKDMLKWHRALLHGTVLSRESVDLMTSSQAGNYGYGWWLESRYGRRLSFHDGFLDGFNCTYDRWLDDSLLVLVFSNDDEAPVGKIAHGLAAIMFGEQPVIPVQKTAIALEPGLLREYVGRYESENGFTRYVILESDTLHTYLAGQPPYHVLPESPDHFFFQRDNTETLTFGRDSANTIASLEYSDGENTTPFRRVEDTIDYTNTHTPPPSVPLGILQEYLGDYRLVDDAPEREDALLVSIALCGDHLCAIMGGDQPVLLWPVTQAVFRHLTADFTLEFVRDSGGYVDRCILSVGGASVIGIRDASTSLSR
jgi:CubicO group peptidase (beta-lactamase class C family)